MSESRVLLDPTSEQKPAKRERVDRPASLEGLTVGLLDISKNRGDVFLDRVESHLAGRGLAVKRYRKPTFTRPAPVELQQQIVSECDDCGKTIIEADQKYEKLKASIQDYKDKIQSYNKEKEFDFNKIDDSIKEMQKKMINLLLRKMDHLI